MHRSIENGITGKVLTLAMATAMAAFAPAAARAQQSQTTTVAQTPRDNDPKEVLVQVLEAACLENVHDFSRYLLSDSARSLATLPDDEQKMLLKRFSLTTVPGRTSALLDAQNRTVVRCDTPGETMTYHLSAPRLDSNVASVTVAVEGNETVDFGLVKQPDGWRLLSLGLLVINVPALVQQWQQAELAANDQAAVVNLVMLEEAIKTYHDAFHEFPQKLAQLGPAEPNQVSPDHAQLVPVQLASADADGYRFLYHTVTNSNGAVEGFELSAVPDEYGKTGQRSFFLDEEGKLHAVDRQGAPATAEDPEITPPQPSNPS